MAKEIDTTNPKIDRVIRQIQDGEIKIPPLQRPFVWKSEQVIELLESIYNEYPIGSILLWETNMELPSTRNIAGFDLPRKPESHPFYYVLDGQQRLSSLYGIFCENRSQSVQQEEDYRVDVSVFDISFEFSSKSFVSKGDKKKGQEYLDMQSLFQTGPFLQKTKSLSAGNVTLAEDLLSKFSNYEIPVIITKKRELKEVGSIFERVNNTGKRLDLFDLMVAITWSENFHLHDKFKHIQKLLKNKNFSGIKNKILLQCLSAIINKSSKIGSITNLKQVEVQENIHLLNRSIELTIDYLSNELSVKTINLLPHAHQIVPLCYFFSKAARVDSVQKKAINEWFVKTSFSNRYSASTDQHINEDVESFEQLLSGNQDAFKKINYTVTSEQLKNTKFSRSNPFTRAFIVILARKTPLDLTNGIKVDCGDALSSFNKKEYHHIFPQAFLGGQKGWSNAEIYSLCNFCILPSSSNKLISDKAPSEYFSSIVPKRHLKEILDTNLLPVNLKIYQEDKYAEFLESRSKEIINYLDSLLL